MTEEFEAQSVPGDEGGGRNTTLIIIAIVVLVLLCCCCATLWVAWNYGDTWLDAIESFSLNVVPLIRS